MLCPTCPTERLVITERRGIEIDYCPSCRGVWLDRGELDKLIDSAAAAPVLLAAPAGGRQLPPPATRSDDSRVRDDDRDYDRDDDRDDDDDRSRQYSGAPKKKKRGGFLGEMFDF